MTEKDTETLSPEEQAFFESGGEKEITTQSDEVQDDGRQEEAQAEANEAETGVLKPESDEGEPEKGKSKTIPFDVFHAEREEHKKTRSELQELKEFRASMEERWKQYEQTQKAKEEPEDKPPDPNEDIFGAFEYERKKREALENEWQQTKQQQEQARHQTEQEKQVWNYWEADAQRYIKENSDFGNAAKWLSETRDKQLQALGNVDSRFADPRARNAQIEAELKQIVVAAAQRQMSPAEMVYQLAQSYGYSPQQAEKAAQSAEGGNELSEKLQKLDKAQNASKTIGQASGRSGGDETTAESLAAMSEAEFENWLKEPANARRFERMMGAGQ